MRFLLVLMVVLTVGCGTVTVPESVVSESTNIDDLEAWKLREVEKAIRPIRAIITEIDASPSGLVSVRGPDGKRYVFDLDDRYCLETWATAVLEGDYSRQASVLRISSRMVLFRVTPIGAQVSDIKSKYRLRKKELGILEEEPEAAESDEQKARSCLQERFDLILKGDLFWKRSVVDLAFSSSTV